MPLKLYKVNWLPVMLFQTVFLPAILHAQLIVMDCGSSNTFNASATATNFSWQLDGVSVGGNSSNYVYAPQVYDVGTHYLTVRQTLLGGATSNMYWGVRARLNLPAAGTNFYVDGVSGFDSNNGKTTNAAFKTIDKARDIVRGLARPLPTGGVTVWLRGGTYYRTNTLMLTNANDSGTVTAPVVYRSYPGETAIVSGGKSIAAASFIPLNSSQTNRVSPGVNPTNIWEMDVAAASLAHAASFPTEFNQWYSFNTYNSGVDGGLCELFFNGQRQFLSRYPNHNLTNDDLLTTNMMMDGVAAGRVNAGTTLLWNGDSTNYLSYPGTYTNSSGAAVAVGGAFYCKTNDIARFARWQTAITNGGLWLQGYWRVAWQTDGLKVIGFDNGSTNHTVLLATNASPGGGLGSKYARPVGNKTEPFWALNLLEEMDQPGEWAVDFNRNKIYFYAPGPITNGAVVISDFGSPLVQIGGGSNTVFQSLTFEAGLAQGVYITNGVRNFLLGCSFRNMGNYPVDIYNGGTNGVVSCNLRDMAAGGVLLRGGTESTNAASRVPLRHFVVNNVITNFARVVRVYAAAVDAGYGGAGGAGGGGGHTVSVGMRVANNRIANSPHGAVLHGSWDSIFEYNDISHFQQVSDDLGAFYSYDYTYQHGNQTFRYNLIHDTPLGNGIDFDQDALQMHIYGNVMNLNTIPAETQGFGVVYHDYNQDVPGREQYADCWNNLFANAHFGTAFVSPTPAVIEANAATFCNTPYTWKLVTVGVSTNTIVTSTQAAMQSGPNTNYSSDPGFLNLTNNDLRLKPDSRIYADLPNFQQIPVELMGLYNDELRADAGGYSPYITTTNATAVTRTNAIFNGQLYFPQFESNTTVTVYYGATDGGSNSLSWHSSTNLGVFAAGNISAVVGGLTAGTNYYFRLFAANAYGSAWSPASYSLVSPPPPPASVFTNLSPSQVVLSNTIVTFSGQVIATGALYPTNGETVTVTVNGSDFTSNITNATGNFAVSFDTTNIPASTAVYSITYYYPGNALISAATNNSTTLAIAAPTVIWTGTAGTDFETGGIGGNWNDYPAPINDLVSSAAIFGPLITANLPALTQSRSVRGLSFVATNGGWSLSGSPGYLLSLGSGGITTAGQTGGTNLISAKLNLATNQTWQVGSGGTLLFTGSLTNSTAGTNYSLTVNAGANTGNLIISPAAGNSVSLNCLNTNASIIQLKAGGTLQLGGDGLSAPLTVSSNFLNNLQTNSTFGTWGINGSSRLQVNSGIWNTGDLGKNGGDRFTGTLDVRGGTIIFAGARYLGEGTINVSGGKLKVANVGSGFSNGGKFSPGSVFASATGVATMNVTGGFVDIAQAAIGNTIGATIGTLLNVSGGVFQNGVTVGGGLNGGTVSTLTIGGAGTGTNNNLTALTLAGGTVVSAGAIQAAGSLGTNSVNNFNFMGGTLAAAGLDATYLGSSPTATATANQTNTSVAIGTLVNYGGTLSPGGAADANGVYTNGAGRMNITGGYAISNSVAVLAVDIGGTNSAIGQFGGTNAFDRVTVSGAAALDGQLWVSLLNGFAPSPTDSFVILIATNGVTGTFSNLDSSNRLALANDSGHVFHVTIGSTNVTLDDYAVAPVPAVTVTPASTNATCSGSVTFTAPATGGAPLRYQWFDNSGAAILAATNSTLTVTGISAASVGTYTVVVTNVYGGATNYGAIANFAPPVAGAATYRLARGVPSKIAITNLLANVTIGAGDGARLTAVTATTNGVGLSTNTDFVVVPGLLADDRFTYVVSGKNCSAGLLASNVVTLRVLPPWSGTVFMTTNGSARLSFYGVTNYSYVFQRSTNLLGGSGWRDIATNLAIGSGLINFSDSFGEFPPPPPASAFYRLRVYQ